MIKEQLLSWCRDFVKEKSGNIPEETINVAADEVYERLLQRIFTKVAEELDDKTLEELSPIFENKDEELILNEMNKHTNIMDLSKKMFEEIKEIYLR